MIVLTAVYKKFVCQETTVWKVIVFYFPGILLSWQDWSECSSIQCGTTGFQQRERQCDINGEIYEDQDICGAGYKPEIYSNVIPF